MRQICEGTFIDRDDNTIRVKFWNNYTVRISKSTMRFKASGGHADVTVIYSNIDESSVYVNYWHYGNSGATIGGETSEMVKVNVIRQEGNKVTYRITCNEYRVLTLEEDGKYDDGAIKYNRSVSIDFYSGMTDMARLLVIQEKAEAEPDQPDNPGTGTDTPENPTNPDDTTYSIMMSPSSLTFDYTGGTQFVTVTSSTGEVFMEESASSPDDANLNDYHKVRYVSSTAANSKTYSVTADPNYSDGVRNYVHRVWMEVNGARLLQSTFNIHVNFDTEDQDTKYATLPDEEMASFGDDREILINMTHYFPNCHSLRTAISDTTSDSSWATVTKINRSAKTVQLYLAPLNGDDSRTCTLTFSDTSDHYYVLYLTQKIGTV